MPVEYAEQPLGGLEEARITRLEAKAKQKDSASSGKTFL
jgi:hypothetical protein